MNENFDITYKALFRRYYPSLIFYATRLVGEEEAEDVVQDVFVELWKRKDHIEIGDQIQSIKIDGKPYDKTYLTHEQIMSGATVEFEMSNTPKAIGVIFEENNP